MIQDMQFPDDETILDLMITDSSRNEGFRLFVNKYKERLYYMIRRMVDSHEDADDIIQNTFLKIIKNIHTFNGQSALFTWVYRIATNECLNFLGSKHNKVKTNSLDSIAETVETSQPVDGDRVAASLHEAVQLLPEKQKMIFNLRYFEALAYAEISEITGTSVGALKASYHHAVKKIEEQLTR
jgi:RNA polymerase sigma factor (sigma-70 family)